jgi:2-polyprenyl-6-methoxyphenol hydroxylase-like FAD-dependent oxidoreductase
MPRQPLRVLISGASVAGPTAAYWLSRQGFAVTVVEQMPLARVRTSGHAVDLFGPAMEVAEWAGVLPAVMDARTRTEIVSFQRGDGRGVDVEMRRLVAGISGRHVEVMRGELATILYEATRSDVQYLFEDSIHTIVEEPDGIAATFEHAPADRFDLVIGADGLHSIVRRLVFGPEDQFRRFLGGYLAGAALPNYLGLDGRMMVWNAPGRLAAIYPVHQTTTARGGFLFRRSEELVLDYRDVDGQKQVLHQIYGGDGWQVPRLLAEIDAAEDFYFDSISQIVMDSWIKGRVTLVGDAGYSPGPAVGGGTSIAMVGAYVLAQELGPGRPELPDRAARLRGPHARVRRQGPQHRTHHHVHADPADRYPSLADAGTATPPHPDAAALSTGPLPVASNTRPSPRLHPPHPFNSRGLAQPHPWPSRVDTARSSEHHSGRRANIEDTERS